MMIKLAYSQCHLYNITHELINTEVYQKSKFLSFIHISAFKFFLKDFVNTSYSNVMQRFLLVNMSSRLIKPGVPFRGFHKSTGPVQFSIWLVGYVLRPIDSEVI